MDILAKARQLEARLARTVDRAAARVIPPAAREPLEMAHARRGGRRGRGAARRARPAALSVQPHPRAARGAVAPAAGAVRGDVRGGADAGAAHPDAARDGRLPAAGSRRRRRLRGVGRGRVGSRPTVHVEFDRVETPVPEPLPEPAAPAPRAAAARRGDRDRGRRGGAAVVFVPVRPHRPGALRPGARPAQSAWCGPTTWRSPTPTTRSTAPCRAATRTWTTSAAERAFRVYDDGSEQGTAVSRGGRTIAVPPGPRGVRLQPGDEIVLGLARVESAAGRATTAAAS